MNRVAEDRRRACRSPRNCQKLDKRCGDGRSRVVAAAIGVLVSCVSCTGEQANPPPSGSACAEAITTGRLPTWARTGFTPAGLHAPHEVSDHGRIVAVLFASLRVHQPPGTHNKVLWVAKTGAGPLHIRAQLEGTSRRVTRTVPEIGPSYVNLPAAGCWRMNLSWSPYRDTIALRYRPGP